MIRSTAHDAGRAPPLPVEDAYWVLPGRLLVGAHPGSRSRALAMERLRRLLESGVTCFLDLTEPDETAPYESLLPFQTPGGRRVEYLREPIVDHGVPASRETMARILAMLDGALQSGHVVYLHCRAGIGRSAMAAGCWLAERSGSGEDALGELAALWPQAAQSQYWPRVPETQEQVRFVLDWVAPDAPSRERGAGYARRLRGAWYGLALGDALASAGLRGRSEASDVAPLLLSQHGALTLCLAESLLECGRFDARDQVERYLKWQGQGGSPTPDVARALATYRWRGLPMAGSHDPRDVPPTSLPRVLAAVAFAWPDDAAAVALAAECSRTTHQSPVVLDACRLHAATLVRLLRGDAIGERDAEVPDFDPSPWTSRPLRPEVLAAVAGTGSGPGSAPGGVLHALVECRRVALTAGDFDSAVIAAARAGGAEAAAYGALAGTLFGARHGAEALPRSACERLADVARIDAVVERLLDRPRTPAAAT